DDDNTTDPASVVTEPPAETEQPAATKAPATPQTETWALNPTLASGIGETGPGGSYAFTDSDGKTYRPIGLNAGKAFVDADGNAARDKLIAAFGISQKITVKGGFEVKDALSSGATVVLLEQSGDTKAELSDGLAVIVVQPDGTAYNGTLIAVQ
ncbi:MAG: hypothetical protein LBM97_00900, partial [Candidatus Nomurabacteria bacterium]|nr:hypothetical protein [Candidatus Nomurabacteria bacterium]